MTDAATPSCPGPCCCSSLSAGLWQLDHGGKALAGGLDDAAELAAATESGGAQTTRLVVALALALAIMVAIGAGTSRRAGALPAAA